MLTRGLIVTVSLGFFAWPAGAQTAQEAARTWCLAAPDADSAQRAEGCRWLIRNSDPKGRDLATILVSLSQAVYDPADPGPALAEAERAIQADPQGTPGYHMRGFLRFEHGDLGGALDDCKSVVRLTPREPVAHHSCAAVRLEQGDLVGALAASNEAVRLSPRWAPAFVKRAVVRYRMRDYRNAMADYDRALAQQPEDADALNGRGNTHRALGDLQAARRDYEQALRSDPRFAHALGDRCIIRFRLSDPGAFEDCDAGVAAAAWNVGWAHVARASVRLQTGDPEGAARDLDEALQRSPRSALAFGLRALLRARQGGAADTEADMAAARRLDPDIEVRAMGIFGAGIAR